MYHLHSLAYPSHYRHGEAVANAPLIHSLIARLTVFLSHPSRLAMWLDGTPLLWSWMILLATSLSTSLIGSSPT